MESYSLLNLFRTLIILGYFLNIMVSLPQLVMVGVVLTLLLLHYQTLEGSAGPISCYDDSGKAVDWSVGYAISQLKVVKNNSGC